MDPPRHEDPLDDVDAPGDATRGPIVELMRKVAFAGLGALFMTEEGIRSLAGQLKLPKEALGFVLSQAERTKDEVDYRFGDSIQALQQDEAGVDVTFEQGDSRRFDLERAVYRTFDRTLDRERRAVGNRRHLLAIRRLSLPSLDGVRHRP